MIDLGCRKVVAAAAASAARSSEIFEIIRAYSAGFAAGTGTPKFFIHAVQGAILSNEEMLSLAWTKNRRREKGNAVGNSEGRADALEGLSIGSGTAPAASSLVLLTAMLMSIFRRSWDPPADVGPVLRRFLTGRDGFFGVPHGLTWCKEFYRL